ncbi:phosphatase PAP2 family protein [Streptomyces sp. NPDC050161]|uniref:phosphatase PAP2 family protein n=1 Tax=Streptomyces sp. NPDC050161 TaxID=3365604 RepID=UPI003799C1E4
MLSAARRTAAGGGRPRWWTELPLLAAVYLAYTAGRLLARGDVHTATGNGTALLRAERALRLTPEPALNRLFTTTPALGVPAAFAYAALHYLVTPAVLVWLWRRRPDDYRTLRSGLLIATLIGLAGFTLFPTAPPRLLDAGHGFTDSMAQYAGYGWWGGEASAPRGLGGLTNQYAAMPSLHVGWALWCGAAVWRLAPSRVARTLAVAYPVAIALVVMGTANHYLLDVLAGIAVMGVGALLARPFLRRADALRGRVPGGVVSAGCETSAGERFPRQPTRGSRSADGAAGAESEPAAAAH